MWVHEGRIRFMKTKTGEKEVSLERNRISPDETGIADTKVRAEIDSIARMIEEEADAAGWPEEADRLQTLARRVRARASRASPASRHDGHKVDRRNAESPR
jgi:hypothetical protein